MKINNVIAGVFLATLLSCNTHLDKSSNETKDFQETEYGENIKTGHYLNIRSFKMYYETYGEGEPLLLIHGNDGSIRDFYKNIPYFSNTYKVIIADSRAQGKSTDTADSLSYEMMAEDFNVLLDSMHIDSCYVIGWSDGGINGLLLAIHHPDKVKRLAITGANLWTDTTAITPFFFNWIRIQSDSLFHLKQTPENKNKLKLINLMRDEPHITLEQLHDIKCPTLVISGDHDEIQTHHTLLIAQAIPKSYLWILPNSRHSTPFFYSEIFNATVNDFFTKPYRLIEGENRFK